jgi:hypothetical protein
LAKDYAVYKGDEFICVGTDVECAKHMGVKPDTVRYYTYPAYARKLKKRGNPENTIIVIPLDDEDE